MNNSTILDIKMCKRPFLEVCLFVLSVSVMSICMPDCLSACSVRQSVFLSVAYARIHLTAELGSPG